MNNLNNCPGNKLILPEHLVIQNFVHIGQLISMHQNLIGLYEEESRLKKHHKPYLHVREYAEQICREDEYTMLQILAQYDSPELRDGILACVERQMAGKEEKMKEAPADEQAQNDPEKIGEEAKRSMEESRLHDFTAFDTVLCKGCKDYGSCFEKKLEFLSKEIERKENTEPDCEAVREKKEKEMSDPQGGPAEKGTKQYVPVPPVPGMVLMTSDTLGVMQDDMIAMADKIDHLTDALKKIASGQRIENECVGQLIENATELANEVFSRWEDADLEHVA